MQIKSVEYAKYGKQNNQHKYLLPEIMPESKYAAAMKTTILDNRSQTDDNGNRRAIATACCFIMHFMDISPLYSEYLVAFLSRLHCRHSASILASHFTSRKLLKMVNGWLQFSLKIQCHSFAD